MQFKFLSFVALAGLLINPVVAGPVTGELMHMPEVDVKGNTTELSESSLELAKRGGYHRASVYTSSSCSGQPILDVENFGCGGTCYSLSYGYSILLLQETTGNPKPTASLFYSTDCSGGHSSAGIWSGYLSGCTNNPSSSAWRSVYLYYNC